MSVGDGRLFFPWPRFRVHPKAGAQAAPGFRPLEDHVLIAIFLFTVGVEAAVA